MRLRTLLLSSALCLPFTVGTAPAEPVGVTAAVNQAAHGTPPKRQIRTISLGDAIIHDELIETDANGLLQILLADGTTFTVGPSSSLKIDSFVYDRDAGTAKIAATLGKGVFRFIGGQASKTPGGVTLDTPVGTVGIRGAIAGLDFSGKDKSSFRVDMLYGKEITLKTKDGKKKRIYKQGYSILFDKEKKAFIKKTLEKQIALFEKLMSGKLGKNGGAPKPPTGGMVLSSGIGQSNSDVPIFSITTPDPFGQGDDPVGDANRQTIRNEAIEASSEYYPL